MRNMATKSGGVEVPIIGMDCIKWIELAVVDDVTTLSSPSAPLTEDCASCCIVGDDPSLYFIWRIHKSRPNCLELLEFSAHKEFPKIGLRITLPDSLSPFAYVSHNQIGSSQTALKNPYLLCTLTVSGVAYFFSLRNVSAYSSCSTFPRDEVMQYNLQSNANVIPITCVAANAGRLFVGRNDGSVASCQLGILHNNAPGFMHELRDDLGIGRLWSFISRGRMAVAVKDLVVVDTHALDLLFVLHSDGTLRVWDLSCYRKIMSQAMGALNAEVSGVTFVKLWVGEASNNLIPLAILCRISSNITTEVVYIYSLQCTLGDRNTLSIGSLVKNIPLEWGKCVDVKFTSNRILILKDNGLTMHNLVHTNVEEEDIQCYALQEEFVAEQLFQNSEVSAEYLVWMTQSIFPSSKDRIVPFVSSIFLRRLLYPGVCLNAVLRSTLLDYNRHWTDNEFLSLTVDGLKEEICSVIECEGASRSMSSIIYNWKNFCSRYFHHWCKNNSAYGLLVQSSTGAVGLVRKNSVSVFRDMETIELLMDGSSGSDEFVSLANCVLDLSGDDSEHKILLEVLRCIICLSQQLGKTVPAIFYESQVSTPIISREEIAPRLLKILETGYSSSVPVLHVSEFRSDHAWKQELIDHKNLRKFSIDVLLSLHALLKKASSWGKVLNVIQSYLQLLVLRKIVQKLDVELDFNINTSVLVQSTSQISKLMFESALDVLLFLSYLLNVSGQINMSHDDISRIQRELIPMIHDIISEWLIIHFFSSTPSDSPSVEDFSSQLSSLQIDSSNGRKSWNDKLGKSDFTLASVILLTTQTSSGNTNHSSTLCLPNPHDIIAAVRDIVSWIIWGKTGEQSTFLRRSIDLSFILFRHGQYNAVEYLVTAVESNLLREKISKSIKDTDGEWSALQHLLGCSLLAQGRYEFQGMLKDRKVGQAMRCFFRASSGQSACQALQYLSHDSGLPPVGFKGCESPASWKLHYYQWVMQIFEQYGISEGACQFALAALEYVDEALSERDVSNMKDDELATTVKGRLWANVFKFTLDLNLLYNAYCAILSNPDEESKYICLRRFLIVLFERGEIKVVCDGQLPFIGLAEKIEQELAWKADRSEILAKPSAYKLLYAFEMHRHNWRSAASFMYQYTARLRTEIILEDHQYASLVLQERLNGLSAAINALHLVHPAYGWIDPPLEGNSAHSDSFRIKKAKTTAKEELASSDDQVRRVQHYIDMERLQDEFVLTSAEYLLSLANVKWTFSGTDKAPSDLIDLLVQQNLYDMVFVVILKFWKGSGLKRELERVFSAMSFKCCPKNVDSSSTGTNVLLLTSSKEGNVHRSPDTSAASQLFKGNNQWEILEHYLKQYIAFHAGLPVAVAETLLRTDPQIKLPLWLVEMFKDCQRNTTWGMTGKESNPASLFQLYVVYGRYTEAINLFLEYTTAFASVRPSDLINRKRPFAAWFPYKTIECLWAQLEELVNLNHMPDQCEKLKRLLHGALVNHLNLLKEDSKDALSSAAS